MIHKHFAGLYTVLKVLVYSSTLESGVVFPALDQTDGMCPLQVLAWDNMTGLAIVEINKSWGEQIGFLSSSFVSFLLDKISKIKRINKIVCREERR